MATLIINGTIVRDSWQRLEVEAWLQVGENGLVPDFPAGDLLVPPKLWLLRGEELAARTGGLGLVLEAWDEPAPLAADYSRFTLLAVRVAHLSDGRAYSLARLLRERYGYTGELRAIGDVLRDQLFYLSRCGFDAFELRPGEDPKAALAALSDFSEAYQSSAAEPRPLFRRRTLAAA